MPEEGLRQIIKQAKEDKEHLESIGDIYDGNHILTKLKELEQRIKAKISKMEKDMEAGDPWRMFELALDELNDILGPEEKK